MRDGFPVSVAELIAAGARPLPAEAVAILLDVCDQVVRQPAGRSVLPAITPSALFLDGSGAVMVAGGVPVEDDQTVQLLGHLLVQMLPALGMAGAAKVPGRLRDLASRAAAGELRQVPVARLAASLRRFAPEQPRAAVRDLFDRWQTGRSRPVRTAWPAGEVLASAGAGDTPSSERPARAFLRRKTVGALVGALLMLGAAGAAYWLNVDAPLPPIPLSPSLLLSEPPAPPRGEWELLDPAGLAVEADSLALPGAVYDRPGAPSVVGDAPPKSARAQSESGSSHRPDERP